MPFYDERKKRCQKRGEDVVNEVCARDHKYIAGSEPASTGSLVSFHAVVYITRPRPLLFLDLRARGSYGWSMRTLFTSVLAFISLAQLCCMDSLHEYDECVEIETARCDLRNECKKTNDEVFKEKFSGFDKDTCIAYAKEHCRTREIQGVESVAEEDVTKCADAIVALAPQRCAELDPGVDETEEWLEEECGFIEEEEEPSEDVSGEDAGPDAS